MADEQNPNDTSATTTTTASATQSAASGALVITPEIQAVIDQRIAEAATQAKNAAWAEARRTFENKQKPNGGQPPKPAETPPSQSASQPTGIDADALNDALAEFPFDREQRGEIRAAARRESPDDLDSFVAKWGRMFGKQKAGATATATATPNGNGSPPPTSGTPAPNPATPNGPPVTSRANPPPPSAPTEDTPIMSMSEADRKALAAKLGDVKYGERLLKELARDNVRVRPRLV